MAEQPNKGQSKVHTAKRTNPETGQPETREFTQEEWRNRNKTEGWQRPEGEDDDEAEEPVTKA